MLLQGEANVDVIIVEDDEDNTSLSLSPPSFWFSSNDEMGPEVRSRLKLDETLTATHLFLQIDPEVVADAKRVRRYNGVAKKQKEEIATRRVGREFHEKYIRQLK